MGQLPGLIQLNLRHILIKYGLCLDTRKSQISNKIFKQYSHKQAAICGVQASLANGTPNGQFLTGYIQKPRESTEELSVEYAVLVS